MTRTARLIALALALAPLAGCNTGTRKPNTASTSAGSTVTPGAVNVLTPPATAASAGTAGTGGATGAPATTSVAASGATVASPTSSATTAAAATGATTPPSASTPGTATTPAASATPTTTSATTTAATTPASTSTTTTTTGGTAPAPGSPSASALSVATASPQAQIYGMIPPDPTTGFDGTLYLAGEHFVPGSVIHVAVNGTPTKVLPATFYSSELLGVYVYLTVPATYTFSALAPDGTLSSSLTFTAPNGGAQTLLGLNAPSIQMVYPPHLDTSFSGTVWIMGDQFMPGCVGVISVAGVPVGAVPLVYLNERTVGWVTATPLAGDVTIQVSNPTLLSSAPVTLTVGAAPASSSTAAPQVSGPSGVSAPFLGTVHLYGSDIQVGAVVEVRVAGATASGNLTPLIRVSNAEAWWTLAYPLQGSYEYRVINPNGQGSAWSSFDVR